VVEGERAVNFMVLVYAGEDSNLRSAISKLSAYTGDGIRNFASIDCGLLDEDSVDPRASIHSDGTSSQVQLLHWLSHNMVTLRNLRVVSVVGGNLSAVQVDLIGSSVRKVIDVVKTMSGHLAIEEFRVACPTYSSEIPRENFFSPTAKANLIVVARDSASHKSIARPIETNGSDDLASHIAVELSVLFGMWKEMETSAADGFETQNDIQDILVNFVSSRVGLLECPALPINKVMSQDGELPLPHQYLPVPDPLQAAEKFASYLYPPELRFDKTDPEPGPLVTVEGKKFKKTYLIELFGAFAQLPKALISGVQEHLEQMSGEALQEAVGGANSSIAVLYPGRSSDNGDLVITDKHVDDLINEIGDRIDRPVVSTIGEQAWLQIVDKVISIADGGTISADIRSKYSNEKFLLTRQSTLSPSVDDLDLLLHELYEGKPADADLGGILLENHADEVETHVSESIEQESNNQEIIPPTQVLDEDGAEKITFSETSELDVLGEQFQVEGISIENHEKASLIKLERKDLLSKVTQIMLDEGGVARSRAEEMVTELRALPGKFSATEVSAISKAVKFAVAMGLSVIYFAIGGLTGRRNWFNFEGLGDKNRSLAWVVVTTLIVFVAVSGLLIRNNEKWQGKVIAAATSLVVLLGLEFIFWSGIWNVVMKVQHFRGGPLAAALLLFAALAIVAVSIVRNRLSGSKIRHQFASGLFTFAWIYVVIGITAAAGSDRSVFWSGSKFWTESGRVGLRNVSVAAGVTMLIVSGFVVAFTIVRERYKLEELSRHLRWASHELERSTDAEKRLRLAAVQWMGTAAVIARLFQYPLGREIAAVGEQKALEVKRLNVLKFDQQRLNLTRKGEQGLTARVRQLFVSKNWLGRQYRQMISRFQEDLAFEQGLDKREDAIQRPENCSAVPSFNAVVTGEARGARWTFLKNVFAGDYDHALIETTSEVQLEAAYSTIVVDPDSHSVGDADLIAPQYFERLIPDEPILLPSGLVTRLFGGSDPDQLMTPRLWWPDELITRPKNSHHLDIQMSSVLTPEKINDPVRLLGSCVLVSTPFFLNEVCSGEATEK
jgi:hypothetical protein